MTNKELYEEIKEIREDIQGLSKEFYIFKGKAFGFMTLMSAVFGFIADFVIKKF